jgi:hypothetical protein
MLRVLARYEVIYGHMGDFLKSIDELNKLATKRGWRETNVFAPVDGKVNEIVTDIEYDDFGQYQKENRALYSDAVAMRLVRQTMMQHVVQGSLHQELLEPIAVPGVDKLRDLDYRRAPATAAVR